MSTPEATLYVCSGVRLDPRYEHSIYFASREEQEAYFARKVAHTFRALSYLRKTWPVQVHATMEQAKTWSYLYFRNGSGKTYYYFITQVEYKNDCMVELSLELDVLQTYHFDYTMLRCFVERQHTLTDVPGEHTVDEGLELGEPVDNKMVDMAGIEKLAILILATINPNHADTGTPVQALAGSYNGVFSGLKLWAVDGANWAKWGNQLDALAEAGFQDGIISMWMYPKTLITLGGENTWNDDDLCKTVESFPVNGIGTGFNGRPATLDGYTPKNKKLLGYPFQFLHCSNNAGGSAVFQYERFADPTNCTFTLYGTLSPEATVLMVPQNYNGVAKNFDHALTLGGYPTCAWDSDVYKMWLAQNQNQHNLGAVQSVVKAGAGAVMGLASLAVGNIPGALAGVATAYNGASQIAGMLAQKKDMEIQPPQAKGNFSTNTNIVASKQTYTFYYKSVKAEVARMLDDYMTMYGYRLNRVDVPHRNARQSFTYVKTVGCKIAGDLCTDDIIKIEAIYDKGITFWMDGDKVADYSQDNAPKEV